MVTRSRLLPVGMAMAMICMTAYSVSAAELQLAGIRLGRSAMTIIQKYGNPSDIQIGQTASVEDIGGPEVSAPPMPTLPGAMPGSEMMPGDITGGQPGAPSPIPNMGSRRGPTEVKWTYRFPKNKILEFIINPDGRIVQITALGTDWPTLKTSKGISLGVSTYKDLLAKYGFPESHEKFGPQLVMKYTNKHRAIFSLVQNTVVGVTIGLMD